MRNNETVAECRVGNVYTRIHQLGDRRYLESRIVCGVGPEPLYDNRECVIWRYLGESEDSPYRFCSPAEWAEWVQHAT